MISSTLRRAATSPTLAMGPSTGTPWMCSLCLAVLSSRKPTGSKRRPWLRTALAVLLLTCLPLWLAPTWVAAANALLLGWLAGFAFHLCCGLARWMESKLDLHLDAKGEAV